MTFVDSVAAYNRHIGIDAPRLGGLDVRSFGENMAHVQLDQPPFRHNLFAIAWLVRGTNRQVMGEPLASNVFFNAPYQIVTWEIAADWDGYYAIFDEGFAREYLHVPAPTREWPFFADATSRPLDLPAADMPWFSLTFERLHAVGLSTVADALIEPAVAGAFLHALLDLAAVHYDAAPASRGDLQEHDHYAQLVAKARAFALEALAAGRGRPAPGDLAEALAVSPGHLNAVVREITGQTTTELLSRLVLAEGQRLLRHTDLQIQEISDRLGYSAPTHFNAFFRRATGASATAWRRGASGA